MWVKDKRGYINLEKVLGVWIRGKDLILNCSDEICGEINDPEEIKKVIAT